MMSLSTSIESQAGSNSHIERWIAFARAALLWERTWPRLWPATGIVGAFVALALLGIFPHLPGVLHALILLATISGIGYVIWARFQTFHFPDWTEAARRLERESALAHRPITEREDSMAAGAGDRWAEDLWRAHI